MHGRACKQYIFRSYNTHFQCYAKKKTKRLKHFYGSFFKWLHGSEGVKAPTGRFSPSGRQKTLTVCCCTLQCGRDCHSRHRALQPQQTRFSIIHHQHNYKLPPGLTDAYKTMVEGKLCDRNSTDDSDHIMLRIESFCSRWPSWRYN